MRPAQSGDNNPEPSPETSEVGTVPETDAARSTAPLVDSSVRGILSLAIPALGALVIEPLLTLIDSVMVGHLGTSSLAALSLASTILTTLVGVFIFLAYSTTAITARALGAGRADEGIRGGIEAMWLALGLGLVLVIVLQLAAPWMVSAMGAKGQVALDAVTYLRAGCFGMIGMLVILAATGTLRGLLDMKTPLYVLAIGSIINVILNFILIYGLNLGILGAGIALSVTQTLMALMLTYRIVATARERGVPLHPSGSGVLSAAGEGLPLLIRTLSLRAALLATVAVATRAGTLALAGHQVVSSIWTMAAFALDALAIAAQSLVGVTVGAKHREQLGALVRRLTLWGALVGVVLGAVVVVTSPWLPRLFGPDLEMHAVASPALVVAGCLMPLGGVVFILDGILIGAAEGKYLAKMGLVTLALYLPALAWLMHWIAANGPLQASGQATVLAWLWVAFAGWLMLLRAVANAARAFSPKFGE